MEENTRFRRSRRRFFDSWTGGLFARLTLFPDRRCYATPEEHELAATPIELECDDRCSLRGFRFEPRRASGDAEVSPVVVFLAGNSGNLSAHLLYVQLLTRAGCTVFAVDYTGFGESDGTADLNRLVENAHAVCDEAARWSTPMVGDPVRGGRIGIIGLSIGANLALATAAEREDVFAVAVEGLSIQREMVRGITLDGRSGPFEYTRLSVDDEELGNRDRAVFPGLRGPRPVAAMLARLAEFSYPFAGKDPVKLVPRLRGVPLFVVHGTSDRLLPFESAIRVCHAHDGPTRLWLIPRVGHAQEPALAVATEYTAQLRRFFREAMAGDLETLHIDHDADGTVIVSLCSGLPEGAFQLVIAHENELRLHRLWLEPDSSRRLDGSRGQSVWALRMHRVERQGAGWRPLADARASIFAGETGRLLRDLSARLHERNADEAAEILLELSVAGLPSPFDLVARMHAARLESLAKGKLDRRVRDVLGPSRE